MSQDSKNEQLREKLLDISEEEDEIRSGDDNNIEENKEGTHSALTHETIEAAVNPVHPNAPAQPAWKAYVFLTISILLGILD